MKDDGVAHASELRKRLDQAQHNRIKVVQDFFDERQQAGDPESAAWAMTVMSIEVAREIERKSMPWEHISPLLRVAMLFGFLAGLAFAFLGVWLVYLGNSGQTEFSLFGQTLKSASVGIAAIFIGAVTLILTLGKVLKTIRHTTDRTTGNK